MAQLEKRVPAEVWSSVLSSFLTVAGAMSARLVSHRWADCFQGVALFPSASAAASTSSSSSISLQHAVALKTMHLRKLRAMAIAAVHQPYTHTEGNSNYDPAASIARGTGLPLHPQLSFWQRGPGWRPSHRNVVLPEVDYFIFEPGWLHMADGILFTTELSDALSDTSCVDEATACRLAAWKAQRAEWLQRAADEVPWEDEEEATCGVGDAAGVPQTRALQEAPLSDCYGFGEDDKRVPALASLSQWSPNQVNCFLLAWQSLQRVNSMMARDRVCCALHMDLSHPPLNVPIPFILPWPTASDKLDNDSPFPLSLTTAIVRGCRWVNVPPSPRSFGQLYSELGWIGRRVAHLLHLSSQLADIVRVRPSTFHIGKRPLHAGNDNEQFHVTPTDNFFFGQDEATLDAIATLLPSSFIFFLGTEHLYPWPAFIISPLAPGWVGGFMGGGSYMDS